VPQPQIPERQFLSPEVEEAAPVAAERWGVLVGARIELPAAEGQVGV
jgi:hypothetical protein